MNWATSRKRQFVGYGRSHSLENFRFLRFELGRGNQVRVAHRLELCQKGHRIASGRLAGRDRRRLRGNADVRLDVDNAGPGPILVHATLPPFLERLLFVLLGEAV